MLKHRRILLLTLAASMAALSLALDLVSLHSDVMKITIYGLPLLLCGYLFGPLAGALAGLVEGFLSQVIFYGVTPTTPLWMIAPILWGLLPGLCSKWIKKEKKFQFSSCLLVALSTSIFITGVNSLALYLDGLIMHYPTTFVLTGLVWRLVTSMLTSILYLFTLYEIGPRVEKVISR